MPSHCSIMPTQTRQVIEDYILHKIASSKSNFQKYCSKHGQNPNLEHVLSSLQKPSSLNKAVRTMVDQYAYENENYFTRIFESIEVTSELDVVDQLSIVAKRLFDLPLKPVGNKSKNGIYSSVEADLDDSHINWGLIITLLIFASNFAVKAVESNCLEKVDEILLWLTTFIDTDLSFWLAKQGGWNDFYHWSAATAGCRDHSKNDSCGSSASGLQAAMSVGVVAACAGLLFMISQK